MSDVDALLFANEAFYRAITDRDVALMDELWATSAPISCVHPGWQPLKGRADVIESWRAILTGPKPPAIECLGPTARIIGEVGIVICYEKIGPDHLVATNLFVRSGSTWTMVHHQAGPTAEPPNFVPLPERPTLN